MAKQHESSIACMQLGVTLCLLRLAVVLVGGVLALHQQEGEATASVDNEPSCLLICKALCKGT